MTQSRWGCSPSQLGPLCGSELWAGPELSWLSRRLGADRGMSAAALGAVVVFRRLRVKAIDLTSRSFKEWPPLNQDLTGPLRPVAGERELSILCDSLSDSSQVGLPQSVGEESLKGHSANVFTIVPTSYTRRFGFSDRRDLEFPNLI